MAAIRNLLILAFVAIVGLSACAPVYRNHGFVPPDEDLAQVVVGQTGMAELQGLVGRPSAQGLLTGSGWYYVGSRWRHYGPRRPEEISREVVAVSFGPEGTVTNIERFGLERGRVVVLSRRVTEGSITEISFIRQLLGSLGNFQAGDLID
ncbi:outer membrane protein assembly factor BamE [Paracoccus salsus]|uniref:outer membrane protein assembly factor BamE n=1 Tax=Paracoccus salsus TaxID=2911061 RepID=UPI001F460B12|nr:outer membrane protein assembly factor BamE [Paracoccus salsus]MCF3973740.1 outer membrane protein assembly factor BamE [Paracoccus salsus]